MVIDFSPFFEMHRDMDRLLGSVLGPQHTLRVGRNFPLVNISEDEESIFVRGELPGFSIDDVEITLTNGSLVIKGERKPVEGKHHRREREYGSFQRVINLRTRVDVEKVTASLRDGILEVKLPKAEEVKPKKIAIH